MFQIFHGWGFPSSVFHPFLGGDRGYFGDPHPHHPSKRIVTHSYGLHLSLPFLQDCEELVILSGFISLKEKVKIRSMKSALRKDAASLLRAFYLEAGYHLRAPWLEGLIHVDLLIEDLGKMEEGLTVETLLHIPKITLWMANDDRVVSKDKGEELELALPHASLVEVEGGHMDTLKQWIEKELLKRPLG